MGNAKNAVIIYPRNAGIAQLVERNLAKVEVESSRLFSRSIFRKGSEKLPFFVSGFVREYG